MTSQSTFNLSTRKFSYGFQDHNENDDTLLEVIEERPSGEDKIDVIATPTVFIHHVHSAHSFIPFFRSFTHPLSHSSVHGETHSSDEASSGDIYVCRSAT